MVINKTYRFHFISVKLEVQNMKIELDGKYVVMDNNLNISNYSLLQYMYFKYTKTANCIIIV